MKNYRKRKSIYILSACHIFSEMQEIHFLANDLFEKSTPQKLLVLRDKISKLISFVEKLPIYGKSELKERKIKGSIYFEHKKFLFDELKKLNITINEALSTGKDRILKGADALDKTNEIRQYIYYLQVYWYDNEAEKKMSNNYSNYYKELKKRERREEF